MNEQVDIVDKNDVTTGQTAGLKEADQNLLLHRVAAVLIFRPNGNLLIQRHKYHGRRLDHSVGGHVSAGEDYETAAKREMNEELRLHLPLTKVAEGVLSEEYYPHDGNRVEHIFGVFTAKVAAGWQLAETEEVDELVEMPLQEVIDMMNSEPDHFLQGFMTSMGAYLAHIGSGKKIQAYGKTWGEM